MSNVKEYRLARALTQPELSRMLKAADPRMDVGMVSRFENGACLPTPKVLAALETALQANRRALFGADELATIEETAADTAQPRGQYTARLSAAIPFGRENAVSRQALARRLGMADRIMRNAIEEARADGLIILNDQTGRGYYQSDDPAEMYRQYQQDTARAMSILKRRKPLRDKLKAAGWHV